MTNAAEDRDEWVADPQIRRFVEYWRVKKGAAKYPSRAALDPVEFRYVLGDVVLVDVGKSAAGDRCAWNFRYRLVGTNVVARDGYDLTRKSLDELPEPEYRERVRATWTQVCETGKPAHHIRQLVLDHRSRRYEIVVLPLASNGEDIDMLIAIQRELRRAR